MLSQETIGLLGLSKKEATVFSAMQDGLDTPLKIAQATDVSRPGVYDILLSLKKRGLAGTHIRNGKKHWKILERKEIEGRFFEAKRSLLKISKGTSEVFGVDDSVVIVHRGAEAVRKLLNNMLGEHKQERLYGFQGDVAAINWNKVFTVAETNKINRLIKEKGIIVEAVLPNGWFERQTKELGVEWAKDFEGRTTRTTTIGEEYFQHGGQLFLFKNSIYLIALGEELIIEIRNSEIQKMLLAFFQFIKDRSDALDVNALLRNLIAKSEEIKK